jgi:SAM-dependent methyltransferase
MSATTTICQYNTFARIINESWGPDVSELVFPEIEKILQNLPKNANILDLCCGAGHLAQKLLDRSYEVTGIDTSSELLRYANLNAPRGKFILDDARCFKLPSAFHAVVSTDYSLNHITSLEELTSVFKNVYAALLNNGLFAFDLSLDERYLSVKLE